MYKNAKILVAGGAGFVGTNLIKRLLDLGASVKTTVHKKPLQLDDKRIQAVEVDLMTAAGCRKAVEGVDYVFMCAANTSGAAVMETKPLVHVTPNLMMNSLMLEAAYDAGVKKYLWLSSNSVYPVTEHPVSEEEMEYGNLFDKYFCVGWMKQFSEVLCQMYSQKIKNPMTSIVVRPANIYGPFDDFEWETSHVLPALVRKVVERHAPIEVWGDGKDIKDLIFIDDFIEGVLLAMEKMNSFDPINIGTGVPSSVRQALDEIIKADEYADAKIVYNSSKPTMIPVRLIDVSKAKDQLGFVARTSLAEGLQKTVQWYRQSINKSA